MKKRSQPRRKAASIATTPADSAAAIAVIAMPVGTVVSFGGPFPPDGWLLCDGSRLDITKYPALQALIGDYLPDLRGRVSVGAGQGPNLSNRTLLQTGGEENHTLSLNEMPAHTHRYQAPIFDYGHRDGDSDWSRYGKDPAADNSDTSSVGGGAAHNNMQPFTVLTYIIKY